MTISEDASLIVLFSSSASLDASPKHNWVEDGGGLPPYVRKLARGIMKSGKSKSAAIAIAISRIKMWAGGGADVDAGTRAKAAAAVAQWNALKAKHKSKKLVSASHPGGEGYVILSNVGSFNTDMVRTAWQAKEREARNLYRTENVSSGRSGMEVEETFPYTYIKELWTDYILIEVEGGTGAKLAKVPYGVTGGDVYFGEPKEVAVRYVEVEEELSALEYALLGDILNLSSPLKRISALAAKL